MRLATFVTTFSRARYWPPGHAEKRTRCASGALTSSGIASYARYGSPRNARTAKIRARRICRTGHGSASACGAGGVVLQRLERNCVPDAATARLSRSRVSRELLRCDRDQHFVLQSLAAGFRCAMDRAGLAESAISLHRKTLAEVYARGHGSGGGREGRSRRIRRAARCEAPWRCVAAVSVFVPSNARKPAAPQVAARHVWGLPARGRGASCVLGAKEVLRAVAGARGGNLQYRPAADRPLDQAG